MSDLAFGMTVAAVVTAVVLVAALLTTLYCRWADRADAAARSRTGRAA
jgi:hypothetical protein